MNFLSIIADKSKQLEKLKNKSNKALRLATSSINSLSTINENIDVMVNEITEIKTSLQEIESELNKTKAGNEKIIDKFNTLIKG